jgi:phosphoribosylformylglycinamidine cyclo-ligase
VAMNVNDLLCVGATPISMVDYIAVSEANPGLLEEIAKGLYRGCELAQVSLSGGELAQVAELLVKKEGKVSFDIVGTAIGTVALDRIVIGQDLQEGDALIGLESSGLHSNGYTLARKVCFDIGRFSADHYHSELKKTIGEELLEPTRIYVKEVLEIMNRVPVKGLFHITGDGLFNLVRTSKAVGYHIENIPEPPPIFSFISKVGNIPAEEMFRVFNMGIGFVVAVPNDSSYIEIVKTIVRGAGYRAHLIGHVTGNADRTIVVEPYRITGRNGKFSVL